MSRRRSPALRRRPSRTVPATLTALVLLAVGVLSVLVAVLRLVDGRWPAPAQALGDFLALTAWGSPSWIAVCAAVAVLGLVLLVAATKAGAPNAARLRPPHEPGDTATEMVISRRGIARLAAARADTVDGVDSVDVSASPRRVRLAVRTTSTQTDVIERSVTEQVTRTLTDAGLDPVPRVSTTARTKEPGRSGVARPPGPAPRAGHALPAHRRPRAGSDPGRAGGAERGGRAPAGVLRRGL